MDHMLDTEFVQMMKDLCKMKPFKMESLMKMGEKLLKLEAFENSKIRASMLQGKLPLGEQIWIRHTEDTDPKKLQECICNGLHRQGGHGQGDQA
jgi:hypothetical protein